MRDFVWAYHILKKEKIVKLKLLIMINKKEF